MTQDPTQKFWRVPESFFEKAKPLTPGLYLVATPIGNLRDMTFRALDVLAQADYVLCEDTRVSGKLFQAYGIKTPKKIYNDHAGEAARKNILRDLQNEKSVALISDAGMPLISDPGYKLVQDVACAGFPVFPVPGANACLSALQISGLPTDRFVFLGFLPNKAGEKLEILQAWKNIPATSLFYENASRLLKTLGAIHEIWGDRQIAIAREITKLHEECLRFKLSEAISHLQEKPALKGEIVLAVEGFDSKMEVFSEEDIETALLEAMATESLKDAAKQIASRFHKPRNEIYDLALKLKNNE